MKRIAEFEKVSFGQFKKDWFDTHGVRYTEKEIKKIYENIKLPKRATEDSAGYDFYLPLDKLKTKIKAGQTVCIPTGIRVKMDKGWVLQLYPRSGHGFKYGIHLANTVGIIDGDYYNSDNEGHIFIKLINDSCISKDVVLENGDAFCQGVFVQYGITTTDDVTEKRNGGMGSTDKKE